MSVVNMRSSVAALLAVFCCAVVFPSGVLAQSAGLPGPSVSAAPPSRPMETPTSSGLSAQPAPANAASSSPDLTYRLGSGDKLKVTVYGEDDLSGEFSVDGAGYVQLPLIGEVKAAGLTTRDFVVQIQQVLSAQYLRDPKVSVQIENYRPFRILGEVNRPGEYPYENSLDVLSAVAVAGGYTYRANDSTIYILRYGTSKEEEVPASAATKVFPGDVVRVPERIF